MHERLTVPFHKAGKGSATCDTMDRGIANGNFFLQIFLLHMTHDAC